MKDQKHEILPNKMNEIEPLNEIIEIDLESLEAIAGGRRGCTGCNGIYDPGFTFASDVSSIKQEDQINKQNLSI